MATTTTANGAAAGTKAWVHLDSWAGRTKHPVEVLGRTKRGYKVRLLERAFRHGEGKVLYPPAWAVTFEG
jgi:hypothetical protein